MLVAPPSRPSTATHWAIEIEHLTHRYGPRRALDDLGLSVPWDQRIAILGPNGAGKTTLLRILATLIRPVRGQVRIGGLALPAHAATVRRHVGLVAHQTFLYEELTARENLIFYGQLYGVANPPRRAEQLLALVGLTDRAGQRVRTLSRGLQQRLSLARAVIHDPPILLLDEPDTGLDVRGLEILTHLLLDDRGRRRTVLLTTHQLEHALELADRIVVLSQGRVWMDAASRDVTPATLRQVIRETGGGE